MEPIQREDPLTASQRGWSEAVKPEHLYPVDFLRNLAKTIFAKATAGEVKALSAEVEHLKDDELDCTFVKYFSSLMRAVLYPEEPELCGVALRDYSTLFTQWVTVHDSRNFLKQIVFTYHTSEFDKECVEHVRLKRSLQDLAQAVEVCRQYGLDSTQQNQEYLQKEKTYLLLEARLLVFKEYLREKSQLNASKEIDAKWGETAGLAATWATNYFVNYLLHSNLLTNLLHNATTYLGLSAAPLIRRKVNNLIHVLTQNGVLSDRWVPIETHHTLFRASYQFYAKSTSLGRRWAGYPSTTQGVLRLEIGTWTLHYSFNMKNKLSLNEIDLAELQAVLIKAHSFKYATIHEIFQLLNSLKESTPAFLTDMALEIHFPLLHNRKKI